MNDTPCGAGGGRPPAPLSRRSFLRTTAAAGAGSLAAAGVLGSRRSAGAVGGAPGAAVPAAPDEPEYLTPPDRFAEFEREKPKVSSLSPERLREIGLDRETWQLEVIPDSESDPVVENPLSREKGTALDWRRLLQLAEDRAVRFLHVLTCTNMDDPLGMGLWEGVPLRDVMWMARPVANIRRIWYHGYHNDDPAQRFRSSLTASRVFEDPPGEPPVILCYKLNGQWLSPRNGGPVRLVVPGTYGNKWVKWLQRIVLTNSFRANDTYAEWNNDVESPVKTFARFLRPPAEARAGERISVMGLAQVGMSGLGGVQCSITPADASLPADDPCLDGLAWRDARVLPPPCAWGGGLPDGKLPPAPLQIDAATGRPLSWPLRYTIVHWVGELEAPPPGDYRLRCRAVDSRGIAQPMPRPFPRSGKNIIQEVPLAVSG